MTVKVTRRDTGSITSPQGLKATQLVDGLRARERSKSHDLQILRRIVRGIGITIC